MPDMKFFTVFGLVIACASSQILYQTVHEVNNYDLIPTDYYNWPSYYNFGYRVEDPYKSSSYGHQEHRRGNAVSGEYRVLLPDGRTQIVRYQADEFGYRAKVAYLEEGETEVVRPSRTPRAPLKGSLYYDHGTLFRVPRTDIPYRIKHAVD